MTEKAIEELHVDRRTQHEVLLSVKLLHLPIEYPNNLRGRIKARCALRRKQVCKMYPFSLSSEASPDTLLSITKQFWFNDNHGTDALNYIGSRNTNAIEGTTL